MGSPPRLKEFFDESSLAQQHGHHIVDVIKPSLARRYYKSHLWHGDIMRPSLGLAIGLFIMLDLLLA
jgi:hypothetical protein